LSAKVPSPPLFTVSPRFTSFEIVLPVYNEQFRILPTLKYLVEWAPVLIVDNFSGDSTLELIRPFISEDVRVIQISNHGTCQSPDWIADVFSRATSDYVVFASCSEIIPPPLFRLFNDVALNGSYHIISAPIDSYTCGYYLPLWGGTLALRSRFVERFFNRNGLDLEAIQIHSPFRVKKGYNSLFLDPSSNINVLFHLRDSDWQTLTEKHLGYSVAEAAQRHSAGNRLKFPSLFILLLGELFRLLRGCYASRTPFFVVFREIASRIFMHISIYLIGLELHYSMGIAYSRARSNQLRERVELGWSREV